MSLLTVMCWIGITYVHRYCSGCGLCGYRSVNTMRRSSSSHSLVEPGSITSEHCHCVGRVKGVTDPPSGVQS